MYMYIKAYLDIPHKSKSDSLLRNSLFDTMKTFIKEEASILLGFSSNI